VAELAYTPLERIAPTRPRNRVRYITKAVQGQVVLDLGALDETAYQTKLDTEFWLHGEIAKHAKEVIGIDSSALLDDHPNGITPFDNSVIFKGDVFELESIAKERPDINVIIAGELIEHLSDPLQFLRNIRQIEQFRGKRLILTTPNATGLPNILLGMLGRESQHIDHVATSSYKTLNTLMKRAGFANWQLIPYYSAFSEMIETSSGNSKIAVQVVEKTINGLQWLFPMLGGGWIVDIEV